MPLNIIPTEIPEVLCIAGQRFQDSRGYFLEIYKRSAFRDGGLPYDFVQDNFSFSQKGVLRGLHYQLPPYDQGKLVRVLQGEIWDVAVDIRRNSPTFKKWVARNLSEENGLSLYIPTGFAHGFLVLSDSAKVLYKTTAEYNPEFERGIAWNDRDLAISWPSSSPILSDKDRAYPGISSAEVFSKS